MRLWGKRSTVNGNGTVAVSRLLEDRSGWYTGDDFCEILKRERNRSNRTGLPISYVSIMFCDPEVGRGLNGAEHDQFLGGMIEIISEHTRDFDVRYFKDCTQMGVLLVDTPLEGAKAFIEKLSRVLYGHFKGMKRSEYLNTIKSISISSYPLENLTEASTVKTNLTEKNGETTPGYSYRSESRQSVGSKSAYYDQSEASLDWQIVPTPDGSAALSLPIFFDLLYENDRRMIYRFLKRTIDIVGALFGLVLFLPMMLLICSVIKLTSRGPVLFKQKRLGQYGQPFTFLKFRSMVHNNDDSIHREYIQNLIEGNHDNANQGSNDSPIFKLTSDPRITPIGMILRKTSLDEIPQFINVLLGTMSLVGPRPSVFYEVETYKNWHMRRVLEAKPGITGLWQVFGRSKTTFDEMVRLDLKYVQKQSIVLDIKILLKTIPAILNVNSSGAM